MKSLLLLKFGKLFGYKPNREILNDLIKKQLLVVGSHSYQWQSLQIDVYRGSEAKVIIGKFCSFSKNIRLITGGIHPINWVSTFPFRSKFNLPGKHLDGMPTTKGDIMIGNDVWIGTGATILSGIKIGNGVVITAGAMVTKDVPDYAIAGGVPARIIKYRFSPDQIAGLLDIKWWNWEDQKIIDNVSLFSSEKIDEFLQKNGKHI